MMQLQLSSKKFGTNLCAWAFFFFGFTLCRFIEILPFPVFIFLGRVFLLFSVTIVTNIKNNYAFV